MILCVTAAMACMIFFSMRRIEPGDVPHEPLRIDSLLVLVVSVAAVTALVVGLLWMFCGG